MRSDLSLSVSAFWHLNILAIVGSTPHGNVIAQHGGIGVFVGARGASRANSPKAVDGQHLGVWPAELD